MIASTPVGNIGILHKLSINGFGHVLFVLPGTLVLQDAWLLTLKKRTANWPLTWERLTWWDLTKPTDRATARFSQGSVLMFLPGQDLVRKFHFTAICRVADFRPLYKIVPYVFHKYHGLRCHLRNETKKFSFFCGRLSVLDLLLGAFHFMSYANCESLSVNLKQINNKSFVLGIFCLLHSDVLLFPDNFTFPANFSVELTFRTSSRDGILFLITGKSTRKPGEGLEL